MSAAATQAPVRVFTNTRRVPRFPLAVPADVTVLRSGIPYSIPGRSVTLGERGVGLVLAGELHPGDSVGIEFRLPDAGGRFRLKAVVRYQALFHCGLEFVSRPRTAPESTGRAEEYPAADSNPLTRSRSAKTCRCRLPPSSAGKIRKRVQPQFRRVHGCRSSACFCWPAWPGGIGTRRGVNWNRRFRPGRHSSQQPPIYVPAEVMERLLTHKIEPIYPEAARQANIQGIVSRRRHRTDGTVFDVRPSAARTS